MAIRFAEQYGNVFDIKPTDKYVTGKFSTSRKDQNQKYVNSSWFIKFVGSCANDARTLKDKDRIKVKSGYVSNETYTSAKNTEKKLFLSVTVFEFDLLTSERTVEKPNDKARQPMDEDDTPL